MMKLADCCCDGDTVGLGFVLAGKEGEQIGRRRCGLSLHDNLDV